MERNKIIIAILVSTFTLITILLCIAPLNSDPEDETMSPPAREIHKYFYYDQSTLDPSVVWPDPIPIRNLLVDVYWCDYTTETWLKIADDVQTSGAGLIELNGLPDGQYKFEYCWCGDLITDFHNINCQMCTWDIYNYLPAKGGDRAFFFSGMLNSLTLFTQPFLGEILH